MGVRKRVAEDAPPGIDRMDGSQSVAPVRSVGSADKAVGWRYRRPFKNPTHQRVTSRGPDIFTKGSVIL